MRGDRAVLLLAAFALLSPAVPGLARAQGPMSGPEIVPVTGTVSVQVPLVVSIVVDESRLDGSGRPLLVVRSNDPRLRDQPVAGVLTTAPHSGQRGTVTQVTKETGVLRWTVVAP